MTTDMRTLLVVLAVGTIAWFCQYVPINPPKINLTQTTVQFTAPPYFLKEYENQWNVLQDKILTTPAKHIIIKWNGGGGLVYMGDKFVKYVHAAQKQGKTIQLFITDTAISMHAMVACEANSYVMTKNATIQFHGMYMRVFGKKVYTDSVERFDECVYKRILSKNEVKIIVNEHKRIVINGDGTHTITYDWNMANQVASYIVAEVFTNDN